MYVRDATVSAYEIKQGCSVGSQADSALVVHSLRQTNQHARDRCCRLLDDVRSRIDCPQGQRFVGRIEANRNDVCVGRQSRFKLFTESEAVGTLCCPDINQAGFALPPALRFATQARVVEHHVDLLSEQIEARDEARGGLADG